MTPSVPAHTTVLPAPSTGPQVEVYSTRACVYCWRAKDLLERKGVPYVEIDATDPDVRARMVDRAGGQRTVPQIFVGGRHVGGANELAALERAGGLDPLLRAG